MSPAELSAARLYWPFVREAALDHGVLVLPLGAILWRESDFSLALSPPGPTGTGDGGHGRGLMQIDDRYHKAFCSSEDWKDPAKNLHKGAEILRAAHDFFRAKDLHGRDLWRCAIAAYNAGASRVLAQINAGHNPDEATTGRNYSTWVIAHATELDRLGFAWQSAR